MKTFSWEDRDGQRWIQLEGELDHDECLALKDRLHEAVAEGDWDVVVVLDGVDFMGSMAIGLLLKEHSTLAKQGRALRLTGLKPGIRRILQEMNLLEVFGEI